MRNRRHAGADSRYALLCGIAAVIITGDGSQAQEINSLETNPALLDRALQDSIASRSLSELLRDSSTQVVTVPDLPVGTQTDPANNPPKQPGGNGGEGGNNPPLVDPKLPDIPGVPDLPDLPTRPLTTLDQILKERGLVGDAADAVFQTLATLGQTFATAGV